MSERVKVPDATQPVTEAEILAQDYRNKVEAIKPFIMLVGMFESKDDSQYKTVH